MKVLYERPEGFVDEVDDKLRLTFDLMTEADFLLLRRSAKAAADEWLSSPPPIRREYLNGITFQPGKGETPGFYNLWKGFSIEPNKTGSCKLFLRHLLHNVAKGNVEHYNYILNWMADLVQRPGKKPGIALVLHSTEEGTGKSKVAEVLGRLFSAHFQMVDKSEQLTGRFNGYMESALLVLAEEASHIGDPKAANVLKSNITSQTTQIERKNIEAFPLPNFTRFIICSNSPWVVPAGKDARRWAVFEVGDGNRADAKFFKAMDKELEGGGYGRLLDKLLTRDLSGFEIRDIPMTEGLLKQKERSLLPFYKYVLEELESSELWPDRKKPIEIKKDDLFDRYECFVRKLKNVSPREPNIFYKDWKKMFPFPLTEDSQPRKSGKRVRVYKFRPLDEMREQFDKWIGHKRTWDDPDKGGDE